jgi:ATP-dependent protease ClpP protease subunit
MKKTISIVGDIGTFEYLDSNGKVVQVNGIQLEDVISQVERLPSNTSELVIECGGLGGLIDVAKSIRGYLKSISKRITITTKQVSDLASANTIIFTTGSTRLAIDDKEINPTTGKPYFIMVHEPLTPHASGNADKLSGVVTALRLDEEDFISMYNEDTGISVEAIRPLMKAETYLSGSKAVDLKIATATYQSLKQAAHHKPVHNKPNNTMSKISKHALDAVLALLSDEDKAKVKKALALAPPAELMGKAVIIDGKAPIDGVYTVVGGVITALESVEEEGAEPTAATPTTAATAAPAPVAAAPVAAAQPAMTSDAIAKIVADQVTAQMTLLKKTIKTDHVPVGFTPETKADDVKEWDRSWKANEHTAMKKNDPEKYQRIFYAKYGKMPNM